MDPDTITEADIDDRFTEFGQPVEESDLMTREEWLREFIDNACCPDPFIAALTLCGCGGSGQIPGEASRLLFPEEI